MKKPFSKVLILLVFVMIFASTTSIAFSYFDNINHEEDETIPVGEWFVGISTPQEFFNLATSGSSTVDDRYYLTQDIDFTGFNWVIDSSNVGNTFTGSLDGNNYKITNLTMYTELTSSSYLGLFGTVINASFQNIVFENVHIDFPDSALSGGNYRSGLLAGLAQGIINVENITIIDSSVKATRNGGAGGLFGLVDAAGTAVSINKVKARNFKIFNTDNNVGGLVGLVENEITSLSISNFDFIGEIFSDGNNSHVGGVIGKLKNGGSISIDHVIVEFISINTIEDHVDYFNKYTNKHLGGIIGYNLATNTNLTINNTFLTGGLIHETASYSKNVGTMFGRNSGDYTGTNNYYAAVQFRQADGTIGYDPNPNAVGVFSIEINNGTLPSLAQWNIMSSNFNTTIWVQDVTGRLYLY